MPSTTDTGELAGSGDAPGPATGSPRRRGRQERAERTRAVILERARDAVLERGIDGLNIRSVAADAGVTWGVVQYHFGDREGLLLAMTDEGMDRLVDALGRIEPRTGGELRDRVAELVDRVWEVMSSPTSLVVVELLVATRATRSRGGRSHVLHLAEAFDAAAARIGDGLHPERGAGAVGLLLTHLRGLATARLIVSPRLDVSADLELFTDALVDHLTRPDRPAAPGRAQPVSGPARPRAAQSSPKAE